MPSKSKSKKSKSTDDSEATESQQQQQQDAPAKDKDKPKDKESKKKKSKESGEAKEKRKPKPDTTRYADDPIKGITKSAIRRLSRKAAIKRMSLRCVNKLRDVIDIYTSALMKNALESMHASKRHTIIPRDIVLSTEILGKTILGYN